VWKKKGLKVGMVGGYILGECALKLDNKTVIDGAKRQK